jgi:hypothetical protein
MIRSIVAVAVALAAAAASACSRGASDVTAVPPNGYCTAVASPGISVTLVDSVTGRTASFTGLYAVAAEGAFRDSTMYAIPDSTGTVQLRLAYNRAGIYDVTVHADRYQPWTRSGVRVNPAGFCSTVINVPLTARLVPAVATR